MTPIQALNIRKDYKVFKAFRLLPGSEKSSQTDGIQTKTGRMSRICRGSLDNLILYLCVFTCKIWIIIVLTVYPAATVTGSGQLHG